MNKDDLLKLNLQFFAENEGDSEKTNENDNKESENDNDCLLYTSPSPRD